MERFVAAQTGALLAIAALAGTRVAYVKPHGALANVASEDRPVAEAIMRAVKAVDGKLALLAISGTVLERAAREAGLAVYSEVYADRGYTPEGNLVPRGQPGALIEDYAAAATRLIGWLETGQMPTVSGQPVALTGQSICVHGDSPGAIMMARAIRAALAARGIAVAPFLG